MDLVRRRRRGRGRAAADGLPHPSRRAQALLLRPGAAGEGGGDGRPPVGLRGLQRGERDRAHSRRTLRQDLGRGVRHAEAALRGRVPGGHHGRVPGRPPPEVRGGRRPRKHTGAQLPERGADEGAAPAAAGGGGPALLPRPPQRAGRRRRPHRPGVRRDGPGEGGGAAGVPREPVLRPPPRGGPAVPGLLPQPAPGGHRCNQPCGWIRRHHYLGF
mmetsp:Transcript_48316/g.83033  ORF Transcript_48316/g.83033 Transcript_48316/m.83033 type:complete len:215 (-) Transcript_48316:664-1308(-)